jgi:hypothetical protein
MKLTETVGRFIESAELREYLTGGDREVNLNDVERLICGARAPLEQKIAALKELGSNKLAVAAFHAINSTQYGESGTIFLVVKNQLRDDRIICDEEYTPLLSFDAARTYIREQRDRYVRSGISSPRDWLWFRIEKWMPNWKDTMCLEILWELNSDGDIWFFELSPRPIGRRRRPKFIDPDVPVEYFDRYDAKLNIPLPYKLGDILTIDLSPFSGVFHGVVIKAGKYEMCCDCTCVYINADGDKETMQLGGKTNFPGGVSPMYRLARFDRELPEREQTLYEISERLKTNPELWEKYLSEGY